MTKRAFPNSIHNSTADIVQNIYRDCCQFAVTHIETIVPFN